MSQLSKLERDRLRAWTKMITSIRKKPITQTELEKQMKIPHSTCAKYLKQLGRMGVIKRLPSKKYAWTDYEEIEQLVKDAVEGLNRRLFRYPSIEEVAREVGRPPTKVEEYLWKMTKNKHWKKPSDEDVERARKEAYEFLKEAAFLMQGDELLPGWTPEEVQKEYLGTLGLRDDSTVEEMKKESDDRFKRLRQYMKDFPEVIPHVWCYGMDPSHDSAKFFYVFPEAARDIIGEIPASEGNFLFEEDFKKLKAKMDLEKVKTKITPENLDEYRLTTWFEYHA